mgnify:CR=1 FL=1
MNRMADVLPLETMLLHLKMARWLEAPAVAWDPVVLFMPWTAKLREDARIVPVFERLGLLDYWRTSANWPDFCTSEPQSVCAQMKGK